MDTKAPKKKLSLNRETIKDLKNVKVKSAIKAGLACPSDTDDCDR
jgi:hypothetical protein